MKLVVCVKQVGSLGDEVEFTDDERDVDPDYLDYALNEWDSFATEEALRLLEAAGDGEVVAVTVGDEDAEDAMRRALAMGADRGIRIWADELAGADPITVARALGHRQCFLAGWRPHHELPEALNAADLLVLPSVAEAFGLVLIEAMACGLPVIAADAHGPAQLVAPGTGWLVPADDQDALAATLVAVASDPQKRTRRGNRAHEHSRTSYGWPLIAAHTSTIYEELASRLDTARAARS